MRIYVIDLDPKLIAENYCDKHLKAITDITQLLTTVYRKMGYDDDLPDYIKMHSSLTDNVWLMWAMESMYNYEWLVMLANELYVEYHKRNQGRLHKYSNELHIIDYIQKWPPELKKLSPKSYPVIEGMIKLKVTPFPYVDVPISCRRSIQNLIGKYDKYRGYIDIVMSYREWYTTRLVDTLDMRWKTTEIPEWFITQHSLNDHIYKWMEMESEKDTFEITYPLRVEFFKGDYHNYLEDAISVEIKTGNRMILNNGLLCTIKKNYSKEKIIVGDFDVDDQQEVSIPLKDGELDIDMDENGEMEVTAWDFKANVNSSNVIIDPTGSMNPDVDGDGGHMTPDLYGDGGRMT